MSAYRQTCRILQPPIHKAGLLLSCENGQNRTNLALQKGLFIVMIWASRTDHFG
jgi:hypothetical protein